MEIKITVTQEQIDAIDAIVLSHEDWIQAAWDGKANACIKRVIERDTNLQAGKLSAEEKTAKIIELKPIKRILVEAEDK